MVRFPSGKIIYICCTASKPALGPTQTPVQWVLWGLFPEIKQPERKADRSPHLVLRLKNEWSCASTPSCTLMACTGKNVPYFSENRSRKQEPCWFLFALFGTSDYLFVDKNRADIYWLSWELLTIYLLTRTVLIFIGFLGHS